MNLQDYKKAGKVKFLVDLRKKTFIDEITGVGGTPASIIWKNTKQGSGIFIDKSSSTSYYLGYPALSAAYPNKTVIVLFQKDQSQSGLQEFFCHSGGTQEFNLLFNSNAFGVYSYGGATGFKSSGFTPKLGEIHCYAVRYRDAVTNGTSLFVDGAFKADVTTVTTNSNPSTVKFGSNDNGLNMGGTALFGCIIDALLTDEEISKISVELLAGIGAGDPKTRNFRFPTPTIKDDSLVFHFSGEKNDGLILDRTGNGYDCVNHGLISSQGIYENSLIARNLGYALSSSAKTKHFNESYSFTCWVKTLKSHSTTAILAGRESQPWYIGFGSGNTIIVSHKNGAGAQVTAVSTSALPVGRFARIGVSFDISGSNVTVKYYIDGVLDKTATYTNGFTADGVQKLILNSLVYTGVGASDCEWCDMQYYNEVKDDAWFARDYQQGAKLPTYYSQPELWEPTPTNVTSGRIGNTDFLVNTGTWKVSQERLNNTSQLLVDGDMEASGVANWVTSGTATATKETDSPHSGSQWLKLAESNTGYGRAAITWVVGKRYRIRGWAKGDGTINPIITDGGGTAIWSGTNSTSWQPFDFVYLASAAQIQFGSVFSSAGFVGFDDVTVQEVGSGQKWAENAVAGFNYIPNTQVYGTVVMDLIRTATNSPYLFPILSDKTTTGANGYGFYVDSNGRLVFAVVTSGTVTATCYTGQNYILSNNKYRIAMSNTYLGKKTFYIKGGAYTNWTLVDFSGGSGTNPLTNNVFTTSKFMTFDLDAGDKISKPIWYEGALSIGQLPN